MIPDKNIFKVFSIQDFINIIASKLPPTDGCKFFMPQNNIPKEKSTLWFRGHRDKDWKLWPSLYRKIMQRKQDFWPDLRESEKKIYEEFRVRNYHLVERLPEHIYLWLSLMQHYGTSTRLLDWSELAFSALFFAVSDFFRYEYSSKTLPCVWVLKPYRLKYNSIRLFNVLYGKKYKCLYDSIETLLQLPNDKIDSSSPTPYNSVPMPVLAPYNTERIKAQTGVFTIFPSYRENGKTIGMSQEVVSLEIMPKAEEYLIQIIIIEPKHISDQLKRIGYKRSMFFPEIPDVSIEIEDEFLREIHAQNYFAPSPK